MHKPSDLSDIHTFVAISDAGTLRAAAVSLGVPTSTVSRSLKRLENSLDLLLVRRTPHGITLTDSGKQYLMSCRRALRILREGAELLDHQRATPVGTIRVGCPVVVARHLLAPILTEFANHYPNLSVEIECYASSWDQEPNENFDLFFKIREPKDSTRKVRSYPSSLRGLFAAPSYLKRAGTPGDPADLVSHRCIGWDPELVERREGCWAQNQVSGNDQRSGSCAKTRIGRRWYSDSALMDGFGTAYPQAAGARLRAVETCSHQLLCLVFRKL